VTEDYAVHMAAPTTTNGGRPVARRIGIKSPVNPTWIGRPVEVSYDAAGHAPAYAKGVLADVGPWGVWIRRHGDILQIFSERIATIELGGGD
jgi:hypothetical protein